MKRAQELLVPHNWLVFNNRKYVIISIRPCSVEPEVPLSSSLGDEGGDIDKTMTIYKSKLIAIAHYLMLSIVEKWDKFKVPVNDFNLKDAHDSLKQFYKRLSTHIQSQSIQTWGVRTPISVRENAFQFIFMELIDNSMLQSLTSYPVEGWWHLPNTWTISYWSLKNYAS